jgi:hypothetical protein
MPPSAGRSTSAKECASSSFEGSNGILPRTIGTRGDLEPEKEAVMRTQRAFWRATGFSDSRLFVAAGVAAGVLATGCGRQALVATDTLAVQRVVVYRNGVAYFERSGHVDAGEVRFKMKQTEVGDFLATLAVMERGGSSVRAASFPLDVEDGDAKPDADKTPADKSGLKTVVLSLDGREHDLSVGYVAESPVWRPSYRLVVHPNAAADLQAWGVVQNLSGEDWKDVKLTLIAGAPLAFQAELGTPVIPPRPTVTDEGEVIAAVVHGETSLKQDEAPPPPASVPAPEPEEERSLGAMPGGFGAGTMGAAHRVPSKSLKKPSAPAAQAPAPKMYADKDSDEMAEGNAAPSATRSVAPSPPRSLRSLAAVAAEGGSTR